MSDISLSPPEPPPSRQSFRFSHNQQIALVLLCTFSGAAAQYYLKTGIAALAHFSIMAALSSPALWAGLILYGLNTGLLILALRDGELSMLYPVISLTYVWVTIMSIMVLGEKANTAKIVGLATVCAGVALLGSRKSR